MNRVAAALGLSASLSACAPLDAYIQSLPEDRAVEPAWFPSPQVVQEEGFTLREVAFACGATTCAATLYLPDRVERPPVVIMANGFCGERDTVLPAYAERFATRPIYPAYGAARAFLALMAAVDRAGGGKISRAELAKALDGLSFEDFSGPVAMSLSGGRQAALPAVYGRLSPASTRYEPVLEDVAVFQAGQVNPPDGWRSLDWIDAGFPSGPTGAGAA